MDDQRKTSYLGFVEESWYDDKDRNPHPQSVLRALAAPLEQVDTNLFKEIVESYVPGGATTLDELRAATSGNPFVSTGDGMESQEIPKGYLLHKIDTTFTYTWEVENSTKVDTTKIKPEERAQELRRVFLQAKTQREDELCAATMFYSNKYIVADGAISQTSAAIAEGDTTFTMSLDDIASTGIAEGDIVLIGNERKPGFKKDALEKFDVVLVKSISDETITIETDKSNFPKSTSLDGLIFNFALKTSLSAHESGTRIIIDKPVTLSNDLVSYIKKFDELKTQSYVNGEDFVLVMDGTMYAELLEPGVNPSPLVANDFLGKNILTTAEISKVYGNTVIKTPNAATRIQKNSTSNFTKARHYIWCFAKNKAYAYGESLASEAFDRLHSRAGVLSKFSHLTVGGAVMGYKGSQRSFLLVAEV